MAENTKIEWADHTFNPWIGCTKVGPGCDNCYAETLMDKRMHIVQWGAGKTRERTSLANWRRPLLWNAEAQRLGMRFRVFCASLADVFDNEVPDQWRYDLWQLIHATPNLDWLLLTKRIGNARQPEVYRNLSWPKNVWLGATICNQAEADRDIPKLVNIPAKVRFLSIEPLLSRIDLCETFSMWWNQTMGCFEGLHDYGLNKNPNRINDVAIDWVIVGGESGPDARPMHPAWVTSLRDQCKAAGVPFLFKQWGEFVPNNRTFAELEASSKKATIVPIDHVNVFPAAAMDKVGKKSAGRLLEGVIHDAFPKV